MLIQDLLKEKRDFSSTEVILADFLLKCRSDIRNYSIRNIAKDTYTSPTTILRFCKKLGFHGFSDFKASYMKELHYLAQHFQNIDANRPFLPSDTDFVIAGKLGSLYTETINDTLALLEQEMLSRAVRRLLQAENIYICSYGILTEISKGFQDNMYKIGKTVITYPTMDGAYYAASTCSSSNCFIILSYSGETERNLMIAEILKKRNIPFITITSYGNNSLTDLSDCHLYISTRQKLIQNIGNFSLNLSVYYLLDVLYAGCFQADWSRNYERKITLSATLERDRISDNPILNDE